MTGVTDPWGECVGAGVVGGCAKGDHEHCTGGVHVAFKRYVRCTCECHNRAQLGVAPLVNGIYGIGEPVTGAAVPQASSEFGPHDTTTQAGETW